MKVINNKIKNNMSIATIVYIIVFFILTVILLVSIVVLKNEKNINKINQQITEPLNKNEEKK